MSGVKACSTFRAEFHFTEDYFLLFLLALHMSYAFSCTDVNYITENSKINLSDLPVIILGVAENYFIIFNSHTSYH